MQTKHVAAWIDGRDAITGANYTGSGLPGCFYCPFIGVQSFEMDENRPNEEENPVNSTNELKKKAGFKIF